MANAHAVTLTQSTNRTSEPPHKTIISSITRATSRGQRAHGTDKRRSQELSGDRSLAIGFGCHYTDFTGELRHHGDHQITQVRELLLRRVEQRSALGFRTDPYHLALVIECGGMRGVAAGGIVTELERLGCADAFDSVHGSSAGACAAAYFFSRRSEDGAQIFMNDIATRRVVDHRRFWSQPCMVDTDYIVDTVIAQRRPLDMERIISTPSSLFIVTTSVSEAKPVVFSRFRQADEVLTALKASLRVPGPLEHGVEFAGDRHLDGGIAAPIAIDSAISAGATHILIAGTQRRKDYLETDRRPLEPVVLRLLYGSALQEAYFSGAQQRRAVIAASTFNGANVEAIFRDDASPHCHWHTIDKAVLATVARDAAVSAQRYFEMGAVAA